jgi:hypothetical protein
MICIDPPQHLRLGDLPATILKNRWAKAAIGLFVVIELYNYAIIPAILNTQKSIETKALLKTRPWEKKPKRNLPNKSDQ